VPPIRIARRDTRPPRLPSPAAPDVRVEQHDQVKVAVAYVADDRRDEAGRVDIRLGLEDAVGKPRDGHAGVGRKSHRSGLQRHRRVVCRVPRLPQPGARLGLARPFECAATVLFGNRLHLRRLFRDAPFAPVELEEQRRLLGVALELRIADTGAHLHVVEELDSRDRYAALSP
jgi:hypothetical protein